MFRKFRVFSEFRVVSEGVRTSIHPKIINYENVFI